MRALNSFEELTSIHYWHLKYCNDIIGFFSIGANNKIVGN
jgi:hypothetical protein